MFYFSYYFIVLIHQLIFNSVLTHWPLKPHWIILPGYAKPKWAKKSMLFFSRLFNSMHTRTHCKLEKHKNNMFWFK